ncbi:MAG: beta-phosphoglucomutase family hydrolase [Acidimicrobiaceae bacterium]|nr:beta-phosphoglucomutase family hydrolase [Acidimicrobiaceae bacterium]
MLPAVLGLPDGIHACLFDLDGVLTKTAAVHAAAWKEMFDAFLRQRAERDGTPFVPFDLPTDYEQYVDGKPRYDGVRDFLASRHIQLSEAEVNELGDQKNDLVVRHIKNEGVEVFEGSLRYLKAVRAAGLHRAVVSSSANTADVLHVTGIGDYFEVRVDGTTIAERHLPGKPAPDTYLDAARQLGVEPANAAVFEDALSGVAAGRAGAFGFVVGVDRGGQGDALREHGADRVVTDLAELLEPGSQL